MSRLSDLQTAFVAGLLKPEAPPPVDVHGPTATVPVKRYNVYRNNLVASLIQVLEARYPVVLRLVGDDGEELQPRAIWLHEHRYDPEIFALLQNGIPGEPVEAIPAEAYVNGSVWNVLFAFDPPAT